MWLHHVRKKLYTDTGAAHLPPKLNMFVLGKSGSGKTSTIQALAKLLDLYVVIEDASLFTGAGWRGRDVILWMQKHIVYHPDSKRCSIIR